jgi:soluble lytic murein transglycosylase-like protein
MSALPLPAAPQQHARRTRKTVCRLHLHLPMLVGAIASAGAFGQIGAASRDGAQALEQARATRLVEDAQVLLPDAMSAARMRAGVSLAMVSAPSLDPGGAHLHTQASQPTGLSSEVPRQPSAADRLRSDAVQTAPVPRPQSSALVPVKLSSEERAIARYIARSYRVAYDSVARFVHHAYKAANEFRLDPHLILAVMAVESSFNPYAESAAGAQGLMQVLTRVHTSKYEPYGGVDAAWDPLANIRVGARILSEYVDRHGDVAGGLKAYVGAALLRSDGGYGSKVLKQQAEFDAVLRPLAPPVMEASSEPAPVDLPAGGSVSASGSSATSGASLGL